jgi:drug/metabolite transporter (DMT)-like permease
MTDARRSVACMALFAALWAAVELLAGTLSRAYSPYQVVFTRYAVHLGLMAAVWGWRAPASLWRTARPAYQLVRSALMLVMPATFVLSLRAGIAPATVLAIFAATPLLILALARLHLGERAPWPAWAAAGAAGIGAAAALEPAPLPSPALALLPLAMAAAFSLYVVMTRSLRAEGTRTNLFYTAAGVAAALSLDMPRVWITPTPRDAAVMAGIGLLGWAGLWALDRMAALAPVSLAAPAAGLYAAFAVASRALAGHAAPGARGVAGLLVLLAAGAWPWARPSVPVLESTP